MIRCNNANAANDANGANSSNTVNDSISVILGDDHVSQQSLDRVIAVINGKGGVLKTTLVANLGGLLAASGFRVLLIDLDPQGNLAEDLGYTGEEHDDAGVALSKSLIFGEPLQPVANVRPNLDVLPGGSALDQATAALAVQANKAPDQAKLALATALRPIAERYDMILLDCPPGDETLQTAAIAAARWALVPVKSDKSSRKGLTAVAGRLDSVLAINPDLDLLGVVLVATGSGSRAIHREAREGIAALFGGDDDVTFAATVRHSEATAQATRERGLLVHELEEHVSKGPKWYEVRSGAARAEGLAPRTAGSVADDLQAVAQELVGRINDAEAAESVETGAGQ